MTGAAAAEGGDASDEVVVVVEEEEEEPKVTKLMEGFRRHLTILFRLLCTPKLVSNTRSLAVIAHLSLFLPLSLLPLPLLF